MKGLMITLSERVSLMEQTIKTDHLDVFRIKDGVLLKVYKCTVISYVYNDFNKRKCEKLAENIYKTKQDIQLRSFSGETIIPAGSVIVENCWVEKIDNFKDFRIELKTTSDAFSGDMADIYKYFGQINKILESYM